jgi:hypothetical protein
VTNEPVDQEVMIKHRTHPPPNRQHRRWSLSVLSRQSRERASIDATHTDAPGTPSAHHVTTFSHSVEQYRSTAVALAARRQEEDLQTILVTSALNGEGKTLTLLNLAMTLGEERRPAPPSRPSLPRHGDGVRAR